MGIFTYIKNEILRVFIRNKSLTFYRMNQDIRNTKHFKVPYILKEKIVVFSDLHRGDGGPYDHFVRNREVFNNALKHYYDKGFKLVLCGDVEEGWGYKNNMRRILKAYEEDTIFLEGKFHEKDRYFRIYGNHDDYWRLKKSKRVDKFLKPALENKEIEVYPGIIFEDEKEDNDYQILITHGCQGHFLQDVGDPIARFVVKGEYDLLYYSIPRSKKMSFLTSMDDQEKYLIEWTKNRGYLLIAGHTHRPNYKSKPIKAALKMEKDENEIKLKALTKKHDIKSAKKHIYDLNKELEELSHPQEQKRTPSYFNAGCCIRTNMISCVEIDSGKISVAAWLCPGGEYEILDGPESLKDILDEIEKDRKQSVQT